MNERKSEESSLEEIYGLVRGTLSNDTGAPPGAPGTEEHKEEALELMDEAQDNGSVKMLSKETPVAPPREDGLISAAASSQSTRSLAQLASVEAREEAIKGVDIPLGASEQTFAGIVTELLRPLVREWLDKNLPDLIERLASKEIEKLVRRAKDR